MFRHPSHGQKDCLGFGKLSDAQMPAVVQLVRERGLLYQEPPACSGRGIVIAGGGKYLSWAWCNAYHLRKLGCRLPIQVWHLGPKEMPPQVVPHFLELGAELVDAEEVRKTHPIRVLDGWTLKAFSVMNCPFEQVIFSDADSFMQVQPEELFNHQEVIRHGSLFFSDIQNCHKTDWAYVFFGIKKDPVEMETGQFIISKRRAWMALRWANWMGEHREVWDNHLWGDKGWFHMGLRASGVPFIWSHESEVTLWGISQSWKGKEWWQHVMTAKRGEARLPLYIQDYFSEWERLTSPSTAAPSRVPHTELSLPVQAAPTWVR